MPVEHYRRHARPAATRLDVSIEPEGDEIRFVLVYRPHCERPQRTQMQRPGTDECPVQPHAGGLVCVARQYQGGARERSVGIRPRNMRERHEGQVRLRAGAAILPMTGENFARGIAQSGEHRSAQVLHEGQGGIQAEPWSTLERQNDGIGREHAARRTSLRGVDLSATERRLNALVFEPQRMDAAESVEAARSGDAQYKITFRSWFECRFYRLREQARANGRRAVTEVGEIFDQRPQSG